MNKKILLAVLVATACCDARADPEFKISGFGTLSVAHSNNRDADFLEILKDTGPGKTRSTDFGLDTILAVQLDAKFDSEWSAIFQAYSARTADGNFEPRVEWANLKYAVTPDLSVRVGRVGLPIFMGSEFRQVNYGNPWVRGPVEVYNLVPVSSVDGADLNYHFSLGSGDINLRGCYAQTSLKNSNLTATGSDTLNARKLSAIAARYENGPFTLRASYTHTQAEYVLTETAPMISGLQMLSAFGVPGAANLLETTFNRINHLSFAGVGASYDTGKILLQSEYMQRDNTQGIVNERKAAYILGAMRFGKLMPYAIYSRDRAKGPFSSDDANLLASFGTSSGGAFAPQIVALANAVQQGFSLRSVAQSTISMGVRYDFLTNAAVKAQFDHIRPDSSMATGSFPQSASATNIVTLNLDFIY